MPPAPAKNGVHVPILETCKRYRTWQEGSEHVTKTNQGWDECPGLSGGPSVITRVFMKRKQKGQSRRKIKAEAE